MMGVGTGSGISKVLGQQAITWTALDYCISYV